MIKPNTTQILDRGQFLARLATASAAQLDKLLNSLNSEVTMPFALREETPASLVVNVDSAFVQNPETDRYKTVAPINTDIPEFTGGTVTFPATSGQNAVPSAGSPVAITITSGNYRKVGISIDVNGDIVLTLGSDAATIAAATAPEVPINHYGVGYVLLHNVGGTIQNIDASALYQYGGTGYFRINALANPMDAEGQLIYGGAAGAPTKLAAGTLNQVLIAQGAAAPIWALLTDDNIDALAAIDGTKVDPNFGSQNIVTTGTLAAGNATLGNITVNVNDGQARIANAANNAGLSIGHRNSDGHGVIVALGSSKLIFRVNSADNGEVATTGAWSFGNATTPAAVTHTFWTSAYTRFAESTAAAPSGTYINHADGDLNGFIIVNRLNTTTGNGWAIQTTTDGSNNTHLVFKGANTGATSVGALSFTEFGRIGYTGNWVIGADPGGTSTSSSDHLLHAEVVRFRQRGSAVGANLIINLERDGTTLRGQILIPGSSTAATLGVTANDLIFRSQAALSFLTGSTIVAGGIGSTGAFTIGPLVTGNINGQGHKVSGYIYSANVTSTANSGFIGLGNNIRFGGGNAQSGRTDTTTSGCGIEFHNRTTTTETALAICANQPGDLTGAAAVTGAYMLVDGTWAFGGTSTSHTHKFQSGGATVLNLETAANAVVQFALKRTVNTAQEWQWYIPAGSNDLRLWTVQGAAGNVCSVSNAGIWNLGPTSGSHAPMQIKGGNNGTAQASGYVGEIVTATTFSLATVGYTSGTSGSGNFSGTISVPAGNWLIVAYGQTELVTTTAGVVASNSSCALSLQLYNQTNSVIIGTICENINAANKDAGGAYAALSTQSGFCISQVVEFNAAKTVGLRSSFTSTFDASSNNLTHRLRTGRLYAIRIS